MRLKTVLLIGLCLLLTACGQTEQIDEDLAKKDATIAQLENRIHQLEAQIDQLEDDLETYEEFQSSTDAFINHSILVLPAESLNAMAQLDWTYEIRINDAPLPEDALVELTGNEFTLTISEEKNSNSILPLDISEMGKISGSIFSNHIQFPSVKPENVVGDDTNLISSATYEFSQLEWGTTLVFELSEELRQRLGMSTNVLTVVVPLPESETSDVTEDVSSETPDSSGSSE